MKQRSLKMKFVTAMCLITVLTLMITSVATLLLSMRISRDSAESTMEQLVVTGALEVDQWFEQKELLLGLIANDMGRFALGEKAEVEQELGQYMQGQYPYIVDIYITTPDNEMYSAINFAPDTYVDWHAQHWYYGAVEAGELVYSGPFYTEDEGNPMVIAISKPIRDRNGADMGVLAMDIKMESLVDFVGGERVLDTSGRGFLLDGENNLIVHPHEAFLPAFSAIGKEARLLPFSDTGVDLGRVLRDQRLLLTRGHNWDGVASYFAIVPIERNGWAYGFSVPVADFNGMYIELVWWWAIVCVLMVGVSVALSMWTAHRLLVPIKTIIDAAGALALGNLDVQPNVCTGDELQVLSRQFDKMVTSNTQQVGALQRMAQGDFTSNIEPISDQDVLGLALGNVIDRLRETLAGIQQASEVFTISAEDISHAAEQLSTGALDQADEVEQLRDSLNRMLEYTKQSAGSVATVNQAVREMREMAHEGSESMDGLVEAVQEIDRSSENISNIMGVIESIAFQTRMLSLNAAVEAARAGVHGKGFGVVADEVRALATRSAHAVGEIAELIATSTEKSGAGVTIARETQEILARITECVNSTASAVEQIDGNLKQQVGQIDQITCNANQIHDVVHANSANAQETAGSAQEMSSQAKHLQEAISMFQIGAPVPKE